MNYKIVENERIIWILLIIMWLIILFASCKTQQSYPKPMRVEYYYNQPVPIEELDLTKKSK